MAIWSKDEKHAKPTEISDGFQPGDVQEGEVSDNADGLQRHLANRQIQLIAIGGSIGTALFVSRAFEVQFNQDMLTFVPRGKGLYRRRS